MGQFFSSIVSPPVFVRYVEGTWSYVEYPYPTTSYLYVPHPIEFNEFTQFKNTIATRFESMDGGQYTEHPIESYRRVVQTKRAKRMKGAKRSNQTKKATNQMRREKKRIAWEHFKARMNLPIGSSSYGVPISEETKRLADELRKRLNL
jgi:hypothetical protein